jgi:hypothetical protein
MNAFLELVSAGLYALSSLAAVVAIESWKTGDTVSMSLTHKDRGSVFAKTANRSRISATTAIVLFAAALTVGWIVPDTRPTTLWSGLSWVVWYIFLVAGGYCIKQAVDGYDHREHAKHSATRKEARSMLYKLIGWAVLGIVLWVVGTALSFLPY